MAYDDEEVGGGWVEQWGSSSEEVLLPVVEGLDKGRSQRWLWLSRHYPLPPFSPFLSPTMHVGKVGSEKQEWSKSGVGGRNGR